MTDGSASPSYKTRRYPDWRAISSDVMKVNAEKNYIHMMLEIDVTEPRRVIHEFKAATGGDFSFTAFLIHCLSLAIEDNKSVQGLRKGREVIIFDDVDVNVQVASEIDGEISLFTHIIRKANEKTAQEIHDEIRGVQKSKKTPDDVVAELPANAKLALRLPRFLRMMVLRRLLNDPFFVQQISGTCDITALGMFGTGAGWGIPIAETSLDLTVGGIETRQKWDGKTFATREILSITVSFDHDIVDGAPATRFGMRFKDLVQGADGLEELAAAIKPRKAGGRSPTRPGGRSPTRHK